MLHRLSPFISLIRENPEYVSFHVAVQHACSTRMFFTLIVAVGWLYVALMMAVAEATNSNGSLLGAIVTFVLYGVAPVGLVVYIMLTPVRKKVRQAREEKIAREQAAAAGSAQLDGSGEAAAGAIAAVRKEP
jgi:hypothetical protein